MTVEVEIRGGTELKRITRELRKAGEAGLTKKFAKELRAVARPFVPAVRASIMAIPAKGPKSTGLRRRMARATRLQVRTRGRDAGVLIRVDGRRMGAGQGSIPAYMEGTKKRWNHPVFGNRTKFVRQPAHPYFYRVMQSMGPAGRRAAVQVMDDTVKKIS